MDIKQIERLMAVMGRTGMKKIALKQGGFELELERETSGGATYYTQAVPSVPQPLFMAAQEEKRAVAPVEAAPSKTDDSSRYVTSPMVGTYYSSPSPDSPPYITVGQEIDEKSVVCIIEAMKVMNEVKSGLKGKVAEILVKNGDPVEFGTKLLRIV